MSQEPDPADAPAAGAAPPHGAKGNRWIRVLGAAFCPLGIRLDEQGVSFSAKPITTGSLIAVVIMMGYFAIFTMSLRASPLVSQFVSDEQIMYYQNARNFNAYGFRNSGFLPDFSTSSAPEDHPFVYTHMPAGPDIFVALVFRVFGENFQILRLISALVFFVGLYFFFRFASIMLGNMGLTGAGYAFLFLHPFAVLHIMDHALYSAFPILVFFPLVAAHNYREGGKVAWLVLATLTVWIASVFLVYQFVLMTIVSWVLLSALGLFRLERRVILIFLGATVLGVLLHVIQNIAFLGFDVAMEDVRLTLFNRMAGATSDQEVSAYYQSVNIAHHGKHSLSLPGLIKSMITNLLFPAVGAVIVLAVLVVIREALRTHRYDAGAKTYRIPWKSEGDQQDSFAPTLLRLVLWILPTVWLPLLAFPAYSTQYNLQGAGQFFTGIAAVAVLGSLVREVMRPRPEDGHESGWLRETRFHALSGVMLLVAGIAVSGYAAMHATQQMREHWSAAKVNKLADLPDINRMLAGKVVMTNIYPSVVGLFTGETVLGAAEFDAFGRDGKPNPDGAYAKQLHDYGKRPKPQPTHYILFRGLIPGFVECRTPDQIQELYDFVAAHHEIVHETELFTIFKLSR